MTVTATIDAPATAVTFEFGEAGNIIRSTYDESDGEARGLITEEYRSYKTNGPALVPTEIIRTAGSEPPASMRILSVQVIEGPAT